MNDVENPTAFVPSASEYILDNFEPTDRIAMMVLNRDFGETIQRITSAHKASSPEFQAWLRYKNANGSDIYVGQNPLPKDASTRTREDIESIRHVYLDLDHGGPESLESVENSSAVPKPNYVLTSSPGKFQVVWKVDDMSLDEAEGLLHAMAREFGGDPAATDATRVLRLPGFTKKKGTSMSRLAGSPRKSTTFAISNSTSTPTIHHTTTTTIGLSGSLLHGLISASPNTIGLSRSAPLRAEKNPKRLSVRLHSTAHRINPTRRTIPEGQSQRLKLS